MVRYNAIVRRLFPEQYIIRGIINPSQTRLLSVIPSYATPCFTPQTYSFKLENRGDDTGHGSQDAASVESKVSGAVCLASRSSRSGRGGAGARGPGGRCTSWSGRRRGSGGDGRAEGRGGRAWVLAGIPAEDLLLALVVVHPLVVGAVVEAAGGFLSARDMSCRQAERQLVTHVTKFPYCSHSQP